MGGDTADKKDTFIVHVKGLIDAKNVAELKNYFFAEEYKDLVGELAWDLVPILCNKVTENDANESPELFSQELIDFCEDALNYLAEVGNPKELFLGLLEQADTFKEDVKLKVLLKAVQTVLLRLPAKRQYSLEIAMETLFAHVEQQELPESENLEGDEKMLLDCDPRVTKLAQVIQALLDFLRPFVAEIPPPSKQSQPLLEQKRVIVKTLVTILGTKFAFLELSVGKNGSKSDMRLGAEQLMSYMAHMCKNFHSAIAWLREMTEPTETADKDSSLNEPVPLLGISCFLYLVHSEGLNFEQYPSVYHPEFMLRTCLPYIMLLNEQKQVEANTKGIQMFVKLVENILPDTLERDVWLDDDCFKRILRDLVNVMIYCSRNELRQICVKILPNLVEKFTSNGKRDLLFFFLKSNAHSGFRGYVTQMLKNEIDRLLNLPELDFCATDLDRFFNVIFHLPNGAETELLENSDAIMAALNLARYLCIRDKADVNATGIWSRVLSLETNYFDPLRIGINMSRAHYQLELDNFKKGKGEKPPEGIDFMVGGMPLPSMPRDQQITILETAIHSFDMMNTVLVRAEEIIQHGKKSRTS